MQHLIIPTVFTTDYAKIVYNNGASLAYQTPGSSGFDLRAISINNLQTGKITFLNNPLFTVPKQNEDFIDEYELLPLQTVFLGGGIKVAIPQGYEIQVRSRSGLAAKNAVFTLNSPGTVDSDYRGEVCVILTNLSNQPFKIKSGDRLAQAVLCPILKAIFDFKDDFSSEKNESVRKENGFGSTGIK